MNEVFAWVYPSFRLEHVMEDTPYAFIPQTPFPAFTHNLIHYRPAAALEIECDVC